MFKVGPNKSLQFTHHVVCRNLHIEIKMYCNGWSVTTDEPCRNHRSHHAKKPKAKAQKEEKVPEALKKSNVPEAPVKETVPTNVPKTRKVPTTKEKVSKTPEARERHSSPKRHQVTTPEAYKTPKAPQVTVLKWSKSHNVTAPKASKASKVLTWSTSLNVTAPKASTVQAKVMTTKTPKPRTTKTPKPRTAKTPKPRTMTMGQQAAEIQNRICTEKTRHPSNYPIVNEVTVEVHRRLFPTDSMGRS